MKKIRIATWNLKRKGSLISHILNEYDFRNESIILWITEPPSTIPASKHYQLVSPLVKKTNGYLGYFILSNDFSFNASTDTHEGERIFGLRANNAAIGQSFYLVGVHLLPLLSGQRQPDLISSATLDFRGVKQHSQHEDVNYLMLGDFNNQPNDENIMTNLTILGSERDKKRVLSKPFYKIGQYDPNNPNYTNRVARLYNPAMVYTGCPVGSLKDTSRKTNQWRLVDQILLASKLAQNYVDNSFRVLNKIGGQDLTSINRHEIAIKKTRFSDHLPVELLLEFK